MDVCKRHSVRPYLFDIGLPEWTPQKFKSVTRITNMKPYDVHSGGGDKHVGLLLASALVYLIPLHHYKGTSAANRQLSHTMSHLRRQDYNPHLHPIPDI